ncbi:MAG: ribose ABC transporter substrate-binding protein [Clostridia bacterium BRH_c25]|nr:MAG: ribose ABC transporter substrate-binding protein [Clostridia bacterium BRH_c25]
MKKFLVVVLVLTLVLSMVGCSGSSAPASPASAKKVSILTPYLSSVTTNQMVEAMKAGMEANGMTVTVVDTKGDFAQLASRIEDVVSSKTDAIVLVSADPGQVQTQLQAAFDAGVPVFGCDSGFIDGMMVNATSDNRAMGEMIARYLFEDLMGKKGTVIALTHRPHPGVVKRCEAFDELIKEYPDIKLITEQHIEVPGPIENARKVMENLILSNSKKDSVTAVWCAWDEPAIGATQALQDAGRGEVIVTGVDGNSQAIELINQDANLKATVAQNFEGMAEIVVNEMVKVFAGEEIKKGEQYAPATIITKAK